MSDREPPWSEIPTRAELRVEIERLRAQVGRLDSVVARLCAENERLRAAAKKLLNEIELRPGGYDYRPYYALRAKSQLNDPDAAVIELREVLDGAKSVEQKERPTLIVRVGEKG